MPACSIIPFEMNRPTSVRSELPDWRFRVLLTFISVLHIAAFGYYVSKSIILHPFADMIIYIGNFIDYSGDGGFLRYLWSPHTQHRLVWTRIITAIDVKIFDGVVYPFILFSSACLITIPTLVRGQLSQTGFSPTLNYAAGIVIFMLTLTSVNAIYCGIPIEDIYPHTLAFTTISLILFVTAYDCGKWSHLQRACAIMAAIAAGMSSAAGLVVWPILIWRAWRSRSRIGWPWVTVVIGISFIFISLYLLDMPWPQSFGEAVSSPDKFYSPEHFRKIGLYFLTYMGLPETRHPALRLPGQVIGAALTVIAIICLIRYEIFRPVGSRLERLGTSLIMFSLATAVLAAVGRVDEAEEVFVPVRYSIYLLPLKVGLFCLALPWLNRQWQSRARRLPIKIAIIAFAALWTTRQFPAGESAITVVEDIKDTIGRFKSGVRDARMLNIIGADLEYAENLYTRLAQSALYVDSMQTVANKKSDAKQ